MSSYWEYHWKNISISDPQTTVARTKFGSPVSPEDFMQEMNSIIEKLELSEKDNIIDLCAGNGLLSGYFAPLVKEVISVDISQKLLDNFVSKESNVKKICQDLNEFDFAPHLYNKVVWHFAIQHFDLSSSAQIIKRCLENLQEGGRFYIGDIPDLDKKWTFYSAPEYKAFYFEKIIDGLDHVGTWFQKDFFIHLLEFLGYKEKFKIIEKPKFHFNSGYRFDVLIWK